MLLEQVTSRAELELARDITSKFTDTIYFPFSIECELDQSFPESPIRLFVYPSQLFPKYYFMAKDNIHIPPYLIPAHVPTTEFNADEFLCCLKEFRERALGADNLEKEHIFVGRKDFADLYASFISSESGPVELNDINLQLFYMTDEQLRAIAHCKFELPEGYTYSELDPQTEGPLVNGTWKYAEEGDEQQTIAKLRHLPSCCIRYDSRAVAFEMIDPAGFFNNQYVFEEHRRKGLGNAVEAQLIKKAAKLGMRPFKTVVPSNTAVHEASMRSPFWTRWEEKSEGEAETELGAEDGSLSDDGSVSTTSTEALPVCIVIRKITKKTRN